MKAEGFSLIEVLVATATVMVGVASLAQLIVVSADANQAASAISTALLLAEQKMEELRAESGLGPSPPGALSTNTSGYFDVVGPASVRRWSIEPLPGSAGNAMVLQVVVFPSGSSSGRGGPRLVSVKARKAG